MPKYLDLSRMELEFGKNSQTTEPNIRYRYFKILFDANIPNNAFFALHGSPAFLTHEIPLFDFNSTSRQVTNYVNRNKVTIESALNNGQNVSGFATLSDYKIKLPFSTNGSPATMNLFREFKEESFIFSVWFNPD